MNDTEPKTFKFVVKVETGDLDQAIQVMSERIGHDEDYGFPYTIDSDFQPKGLKFVVIDTKWGVVLSEPLKSFDQARTEMEGIAETTFPDEDGTINLGIDFYRGMKQGEETGTSSYDQPDSWRYVEGGTE